MILRKSLDTKSFLNLHYQMKQKYCDQRTEQWQLNTFATYQSHAVGNHANLHLLWLTRFLVKGLIQNMKVKILSKKNIQILSICDRKYKFEDCQLLIYGFWPLYYYLGASLKLAVFLVICTGSFKFLMQALINLGTIHLRRQQIFTIFDPYPPTIGIPAKCL